ncbi:gag-protease polyprotein [Trifolium pratense]|uniref:Gag-protease polyprotein n=1 Tax=Trifolium pratense TaxID=57577 RepID=A0A2K3JUY5_TRIPR|nr:gag-protease polyprotein [Trifolium pratense]
MNKGPRTSVADTSRNNNRNFSNQRRLMTYEKASQSKSVQCHEYDSEGEVETAKHINAWTGVCTSDTESCDEELTFDELAESYKELCLRSDEVCRISEKQKETISKLQTERIANLTRISEVSVKCEEGLRTIEEQKTIIVNLETDKLEKEAEISKLNEEVTELNSHLENLKKHVVMLFKGTDLLDEILEKLPTPSRAKTAIGYEYKSVNRIKDYNKDAKYMP